LTKVVLGVKGVAIGWVPSGWLGGWLDRRQGDLRRGRASAPRDDGTGQLQRGIGTVAVVVEHRRLGGQQLLGRPWLGHGFLLLVYFLRSAFFPFLLLFSSVSRSGLRVYTLQFQN